MTPPVRGKPARTKPILRTSAIKTRAAIPTRESARAALAIVDPTVDLLHKLGVRSVGAYHAVKDELDCGLVIERLDSAGLEISLPVVTGPSRPLEFRRWRPGAPLNIGGFGVQEPVEGAPLSAPVALLVPMLAFDRDGWRLGYGGGYFDRTLRLRRADGGCLAIGMAFSVQEVDIVPHDRGDERLDWVVTERYVRNIPERANHLPEEH